MTIGDYVCVWSAWYVFGIGVGLGICVGAVLVAALPRLSR